MIVATSGAEHTAARTFKSSSSAIVCGFAISLIGALAFTGGLDSRGLLLCFVGILVIAFFVGEAGFLNRFPVDWLSGIMLFEIFWLVFLQLKSVAPGNGFDMTLSLSLLPISYLLCRAATQWKKFESKITEVVQIVALPVFILAIIEFGVTRSRSFSVFLDANLLAAYSNVVFFLSLPIWILNRNNSPGRSDFSKMIALLAAITLIVSTSLAGFLCFFLGFLIFVALVGLRKSFVPIVTVIAVIAFSSLIVYHVQSDRSSPAHRIVSEVSSGGDPSRGSFTHERLVIWRSGLEIYRDHAWYGSGPGSFVALYPAYRSTDDQSTSGNLVHNDYLQFLIEGGPILLSILTVTFLAIGGRLLGRFYQHQDYSKSLDVSDEWLKFVGINVGLIVLFLHATVNFIFYCPALSLIAGANLAISRKGSGFYQIKICTFIGRKLGFLLFSMLLLSVAATLGLRTVFSTLANGDCRLYACNQLQKQPRFMTNFANLMIVAQPTWYFPYFYLGKIQSDAAMGNGSRQDRLIFAKAAIKNFGDIAVAVPVLHDPYKRIADLLETFPDAKDAIPKEISNDRETLYRLAVKRDPLDFSSAASAIRLIAARGASREAFELATETLKFWSTAKISNPDRVALLTAALPISLEIGKCQAALEMSETLLGAEPNNKYVRTIRDSINDKGGADIVDRAPCL